MALTRRTTLAAAATTALAAAPLSRAAAAPRAAAAYPAGRPVTIVVPYPAGGTTDLVARLVAQQLTERLGAPFVVENKPGAAGNIGTAAAAKAAPDGHTLLLVASNILVANPVIYPRLGFDAARDFRGVGNVVKVRNVVLARPDDARGIRTFADLVRVARATPGGLTYGSPGNGSLPQVVGSALAREAGITLRHVPYKGSAPMLQGLYGGEIDIGLDNLPAPMSHIAAGKLRALAVTGLDRSPQLPDVPTVAESGLRGFDFISWFGVLAPRAVPAPIVAQLNHAIGAALADPAVVERLLALGTQPAPGTPAAFDAFIKAEVARWAPVVRASGARID